MSSWLGFVGGLVGWGPRAGAPGIYYTELKMIQRAWQEGLFLPFRETFVSDGYERSGWWHELGAVATKNAWETKDKTVRSALSLFAFLLLAQEESEKRTLVQDYIEARGEDLFWIFFDPYVPPCVSLMVLRYASDEIWKQACQRTIKGESQAPRNWMREIAKHPGLYPFAADFLQQFLLYYPEKDALDLLFHVFLKIDLNERRALIAYFPESFREVLTKRIQDTEDYLEHSLQHPPQDGVLSIPFEGGERAYFVHLFFTKAQYRPNSFLIAAALTEEEWPELLYFEQARLFSWMRAALLFHQERESELSDKAPFRSLFRVASTPVGACRQLCYQQKDGIHKIFPSFSPCLIDKYHSSLKEPFAIELYKELSPEQIRGWFSIYIQEKICPNEETRGEIDRIWRTVESARSFEDLFAICFKDQDQAKWTLALYLCLDMSRQKEIFNALFLDRALGMKRIISWYIEYFGLDASKRFLTLRLFFTVQLPKMLAMIDAALPALLQKELLAATIAEESELQFLAFLNAAPNKRQQRAIEELQELFLRTDLSWGETREVISTLREDLRGDAEAYEWISELFKGLSQEMWPLLFVYFGEWLTLNQYNGYFEEKLPGYMFKQAMQHSLDVSYERRMDPIVEASCRLARKRVEQSIGGHPLWLSSKEEWIELAVITLALMNNNPPFCVRDDRRSEALRQFYQVACETKTIREIVEFFCTKAPREKWLPVLDQFKGVCFDRIKEDFDRFLVECIEVSQEDKIEFIVDRFIAFDQSETRGPIGNLNLFEAPFIATDEEAIAALNSMIRRLGVQFLGYFYRQDVSLIRFIQALKSMSDEGKGYLQDWIQGLVKTNNSASDKIVIFQEMGKNFFQNDSKAFLEILHSVDFSSFLGPISEWYQTDIDAMAQAIDCSSMALALLKHFNEEAFYPTISSHIKNLQTEGDLAWFYISRALENLSKVLGEEKVLEILSSEELASFRDVYRERVKSKGIGSTFGQDLLSGKPLMTQFAMATIEDWEAKLIAWSIEQLQTSHDNQASRQRFFWHPLRSVYKTLDGAGQLERWRTQLEAALPDFLQEDFKELNEAYADQEKQVYL